MVRARVPLFYRLQHAYFLSYVACHTHNIDALPIGPTLSLRKESLSTSRLMNTHTQLIVLRRNTKNPKMDLKYFKINKKIPDFLPCPNCSYNTSGDPTRRRTTGARGPLVAGAEVRRAGVCKDDCMQKNV